MGEYGLSAAHSLAASCLASFVSLTRSSLAAYLFLIRSVSDDWKMMNDEHMSDERLLPDSSHTEPYATGSM